MAEITHEQQAKALIEAMPHMQQFRGKTIVIKYGGAAMEDPAYVERALRDIVFLELVGINPVLVHGGGKAITAEMARAGIQARFIDGFRVTDKASIDIVERVLSSTINPEIVEKIRAQGGSAMGFPGNEIFVAEKTVHKKADSGESVDLGYVGEVVHIRAEKIFLCLEQEIVPVISPIGVGLDKATYNINADVAAAELAIAVRAHKIIYVSDVNGIWRDPKDPASVIPTISESQIEELKTAGIISGGMLPKVNSAVKALRNGVNKIHLIDGRIPHSLLLELFTDSGIGTQITR